MNTIDNEYYKIKTENYSFYLIINKNIATHTITIGGKKEACVNISVNTEKSLAVQRKFHKLDTATIPILGWDSLCSIDKPLERGSGTLHMIKTILSETQKRYPYITNYTLTDNSHIRCTSGKDISLSALSLIEYKMSWYERHFNASLSDDRLKEKYKKGKDILSEPELKMPLDQFQQYIRPYTSIKVIQSLEPFYNSETYFGFFENILKHKGKYETCDLVVDWIDIFIKYIFQFDIEKAEWSIPTNSIETIITESKELKKNPYKNQNSLQSGGTRKNRVNVGDGFQKEYSA